VQFSTYDDIFPTLECPDNVTIHTRILPDISIYVNASDNCVVSVSQSRSIGSPVTNNVPFNVTVTANDGSNTQSCIILITPDLPSELNGLVCMSPFIVSLTVTPNNALLII
jgi:hypothetical protein